MDGTYIEKTGSKHVLVPLVNDYRGIIPFGQTVQFNGREATVRPFDPSTGDGREMRTRVHAGGQ